ncbi:MAG: bifunctional diaminohydroxyphosphoribosylaminopyrimidine deaminase/5-amino-6-(5-phosphoribosylamino)uracil reductase RibD [Planctomycetota bacterium]
MQRALRVARRGYGQVAPNPPVGAVAVKNGRVVGEGWHRRCGEAHGEAHLIARTGKACRGADLYVTLEPCCHHGKTPPCTDAVIAAGFRRVFYAVPDPNPITAGRGPRRLKRHGIEVQQGLLEAQARRQLAPYLSAITRKRPLVTAKWAMTLDGKIATRTGDSQWISPPELRERTRKERSDYDAILVGHGTVAADDPELISPLVRRPSPLRVVLDSQLRLPPRGKLVTTLDRAPLLVVGDRTLAKQAAFAERQRGWEEVGAEVLLIGKDRHGLSLRRLLTALERRGVHNLLVEGGSQVHGSFIDRGLVDRLQVIVGPQVVGGVAAPGPVAGQGAARLSAALGATDAQLRQVGRGWLLTADSTAAGRGDVS